MRHTEQNAIKCFHYPPPIKMVLVWRLLFVKQMLISYEELTLKRLEIFQDI